MIITDFGKPPQQNNFPRVSLWICENDLQGFRLQIEIADRVDRLA
jgi:hypothetical protein